MIHIALYQPDIPQNVGAAIRLCACLGLTLDIIEPCGFPWDKHKIRRSAMDYIDLVNLHRHASWGSFLKAYPHKRLVLMTTKTDQIYTEFEFSPDDILVAGRESAGVPLDIHQGIPHHITIPLNGQARSLNVINATAIIAGEALRQIS